MTETPQIPTREPADSLSQVAARNLQVAEQLRHTAWQLAEAGVRAFRPTLDEEAVQAEVRSQFLRAAG